MIALDEEAVLEVLSDHGAHGRSRARPYLAVGGAAVFYLALAMAAYWGVVPWSSNRLVGNGLGDPAATAWFLEWSAYAVVHHVNIFHTTLVDYPIGINLANNPAVPLLGVLATPLTWRIGPVGSLNVLVHLSVVISSLAMFLLLRTRCRSFWPALAGGAFYGLSPYVASHLAGTTDHLDLAFIPLPCVFYWCFEDLFVRQKHRPWLVGVIVGLAASAQVLIAPEVLAECAVIATVAVAYLGVRFRNQIRSRARWLVIGLLSAAMTFVALAGVPVWWLVKGPGHLTGPVQPRPILETFHGDLVLTVLPNQPRLLSYGPLLRAGEQVLPGLEHSEMSGYLGLPIVVFVVFVVVTWRKSRSVTVPALLGAVSFVFSIGTRLSVDGHVFKQIPMPDAILYHLPLLSSTLAARFALETSLFVAVVFALGLDGVLTALSRLASRRQRSLATSAAAGWCFLSLLTAAPKLPFTARVFPWSSEFPNEIARIAQGRPVLTFPYADPPFAQAMVWQADAHLSYPLLGGYATVNGPEGGQFWPPLMGPVFVQQFLGYADAGPFGHYGDHEPTAQNEPSLLCEYIVRYHVGVVAYFPRGKLAGKTRALFFSTLGTPRENVGKGIIWTTQRCD